MGGHKPLHPDMTSRPIICTSTTQPAGQDTLLLVLYGANTELIFSLIKYFKNNIEKKHGADVKETLDKITEMAEKGLDYARAAMLLLLNVDTIGKRWLCVGSPELKIAPLCKNKAPHIFKTLATEVIPAWHRNEALSVQQLVNQARSAYLVA
jgi:hypothetical protein